ncbi:MAG: TonB-dependent vitamin B12 receptor [Thiothrix sp.]|uniref:TonB-dependent vitamin B12 receptor n=1 Tax=Thiothrix sp. TaxID=1032 RepID=UPI002613E479|nr:TonB-dependent vitamin B12 receptor [Thiothrix sp.]MDD5395361.1 TonB-dependent vitamin B12 receptor [Thiothrix sp.]
MKKLPLAALLGTAFICLSVSPLVLAEDANSLDTVVVTADRKARTVDETLAPVSIITRKDIEKYQAISLPEVLRRVPGINITSNGGAGKQTGVFLRGTASNQVLVLVDGVKIGSATSGTAAFQDIPLDQVERIEVVRGPRSSLYGSEAIGGVIQIFTRKGKEGFHPELTLQAGSHNTQAVNAVLSGSDKATWYSMSIGSERTSGINAQPQDTTGERDGYERKQLAFRAGHTFAGGVQAEANLLQAEGDNAYDPFSGTSNLTNTFETTALSGKLIAPVGQRTVLTAQVGQAKDAQEHFSNGAFTSRFNTNRDTASLQADVQVLESGNLTVGADQQKDTVDSTTNYTVKSRKNNGLFASYQHDFGKTDVEVSARRDDNEQFGKHNTGAVAIGYDLTDNLRLKASHGKAFRAPTFNELYYPDTGFGGGDPNLKPEQSKNTEISLDGKWANGSWSVNAFENKINDMIPSWPPSNIDKAIIRGIELGSSTQVAGWDVAANVTLQQPKNATGANAGKLLQRRPKQIANLDVDRKLGNVRIGAGIHAESERYDDVANAPAKKLPGYGTLDLRADYQMAKDWMVGIKIGNALDKNYQTAQGFNQDGINGLVTLKYAPK